ncbi:MAG: hypothetical protein KF819_15605 [Labilithrix sp.]|nr:hypothetical protein [Labilithrix sp.]
MRRGVLAGLMTFAAVAAACSREPEPVEVPADASGDAGGDAPPIPTEAAPPDEEISCPASCPYVDFIDPSKFPWKSPSKVVGACSEGDLDALVERMNAKGQSNYADWNAAVTNPTCRACVFGSDEGTHWTPIVERARPILNVGACIAIVSGDEECGRAYHNWFECRRELCVDCLDNGACEAFCMPAATRQACKTAFDAIGTTCGAQVAADAEKACAGRHPIEGSVRAQCIGL